MLIPYKIQSRRDAIVPIRQQRGNSDRLVVDRKFRHVRAHGRNLSGINRRFKVNVSKFLTRVHDVRSFCETQGNL